MLPGLDGLTLLQSLRGAGDRTPALVLSALADVDERIRGLRAGGDDYLAKPFVLAELAARIEALLRRPADTRETILRVGSLEIDLIGGTGRRGSRDLDLLPRELTLLEYLMRRPGQVVTGRCCSRRCGTTASPRNRTSSTSISAACAASWRRPASRR